MSIEQNKINKNLNVGDFCELKISALAPNNIGIDELTFPFAVFVPKAKLGTKIKAKILKIHGVDTLTNQGNNVKYAIGQILENLSSSLPGKWEESKTPVKAGDILTVKNLIMVNKGKKNMTYGLVNITQNFKLIVPLWKEIQKPTRQPSEKKNIKLMVTRVKNEYGFAQILKESPNVKPLKTGSKLTLNVGLSNPTKIVSTISNKNLNNIQSYNSKNFHIFKVKNTILFLRDIKQNNVYNSHLIKTGDKIRIKVLSASLNYAVGKILQVQSIKLNSLQKNLLIMNNIRDMINHGMHYGEKAVLCHARMKNYIWMSRDMGYAHPAGGQQSVNTDCHVINLLKTRRCLNKALNMLTKYALKGRTFLFIGTKKPATGLVARASYFTKNSFYVNTRWLGGMLTNWKTICKSISKIRPILKEKQKVVREILESRQIIKSRLIKKALLLKKKSKSLLTKGRNLFFIYKNKKTEISIRAQKLTTLQNHIINKGIDSLQKRQKLVKKYQDLINKIFLLKQKNLQISAKYNTLLNILIAYTKKLREYKYLLILTSEIHKLHQEYKNPRNARNVNVQNLSTGCLESKTSNGKIYSISSYGLNTSDNKEWILPNPPKEILNRIALIIKKNTGVTKISAKNLLCSTFLSKFSRFSTKIKLLINNLIPSIQNLEDQCKMCFVYLQKIKKTQLNYLSLKNTILNEYKKLENNLNNERQVIQIVRRQLKTLDAQKKVFKYLPRLKYLPTPQTKISEIVNLLLTKIVDPKLKYSIDTIYDQKLNSSTKKLAAIRKKKWQRLEKYFGGIANMTKFTKTQISRNVAIIIGQTEEMNAVRECSKLGIKMFTIVDTNCNPTLTDHVIPSNDDSRNSIKYILTKFITRIRLAQKIRSRIMP